MSGKQSHKQDKEWLTDHAHINKYLNQCLVCQDQGYNPQKIEERTETLFKRNIKNHFKPLILDGIGRCSICSNLVK